MLTVCCHHCLLACYPFDMAYSFWHALSLCHFEAMFNCESLFGYPSTYTDKFSSTNLLLHVLTNPVELIQGEFFVQLLVDSKPPSKVNRRSRSFLCQRKWRLRPGILHNQFGLICSQTFCYSNHKLIIQRCFRIHFKNSDKVRASLWFSRGCF